MKTLIRADREIWNDSISIYFAQKNEESGALHVAEHARFIECKEGMQAHPFMRLETVNAQRLMDELWDCGLRPSEGHGSAGSLAATEGHLKDMQSIAMLLLQQRKE